MKRILFPLTLLISIVCQSQNLVNPSRYNSNYFIVSLTGDSIDRGTSTGGAVGPTTLAGTCYEWDGSGLVELTTADLADAATGSPWKQFALDFNANTGKIVVFVAGGSGGAEFYANGDNNNWSSTGTLRASHATKLNSCLAFFGRSIPDANFTILGVNDVRGAQTLANIETATQSFVDWFQTNWPNTIMLFSQVGRTESNFNNTARIAAVRSYVKNLAKNNTNVHICGSLPSFVGAGYYDTDNLHLNQTGNNELGKMYARWFQNSSYSKWGRSLISSFFTDISSGRKTLVDNFITAEISNGNYFKYDVLNSFKNEDVKNIYVDWAFLFGPIGIGSPTFTSNSHLATNGTNSQYWKTGYTPSVNSINASQDDLSFGLKVRTRVTSSGTLAIAMGVSDGTQRQVIGQNTTPGVIYYINDNMIKISTTPDVAIAADALYTAYRTGSATNEMFKNTTSIHSVGNLSVGLPGFEQIIGAQNTSNTIGSAFNGTYEYYFIGSNGIILSDFYSNMESVIDGW